VSKGANIATGGRRIGNTVNFIEPTVLTDVSVHVDIMNVEPFGPVVPLSVFDSYGDGVAQANRLPYGLAAYMFTSSARTNSRVLAIPGISVSPRTRQSRRWAKAFLDHRQAVQGALSITVGR